MNKEKIIANIERYVKTLREKEQIYYFSGLENAGNTPIKEAYKNTPEPIFELAEIVQELKREIKEQAQKEAKGNTFVKRSKLITKLLDKCYNEKFKKGFYEEINGEKMVCCIVDGFYAFMLYDIDIPMVAEGEEQPFTVNKMIPDYKSFAVCDFDIADIKTALKLHKAKKDKTKCVTEINGKYYNAEYFINVVDGLGGNVKVYQSNSPVQPDIFESENGIALLCPCRAPQ